MTKFAKRYWVGLFVVGAVLTLTVNGAYAKGALALPGTTTAAFTAMTPPAIFAALAWGLHLSHRAVPRHVRKLVVAAVSGLAIATFAVSYMTQRAFVVAHKGVPLPEWVGWVIPGMLDTLVAVSGFVAFIVAVHGDKPADEKDAKPTVKQPRWGRVAKLADALTTRAEAALVVKEEPPTPAPVIQEAVMEPRPTPVIQETVVQETAAPAPEPVIQETVIPEPQPAAPTEVQVTDDHLDTAAEMVQRGVTRKPVGEVARVLALRDRLPTTKAVAEASRMSRTTVSNLLDEASRVRRQNGSLKVAK